MPGLNGDLAAIHRENQIRAEAPDASVRRSSSNSRPELPPSQRPALQESRADTAMFARFGDWTVAASRCRALMWSETRLESGRDTEPSHTDQRAAQSVPCGIGTGSLPDDCDPVAKLRCTDVGHTRELGCLDPNLRRHGRGRPRAATPTASSTRVAGAFGPARMGAARRRSRSSHDVDGSAQGSWSLSSSFC